ncbi:hypothetical protein [Microbispora triticiradicis]|uniref:hypothetical protein n=1 Tax=Microbispora triticiradicis TaxID=2200763 RepID=UPI001AD7C398|nr:hypothetical protein [Microbispora triticiradicis]MBO4274631.1 hypothetical protein [Microbispora triticiradicis]
MRYGVGDDALGVRPDLFRDGRHGLDRVKAKPSRRNGLRAITIAAILDLGWVAAVAPVALVAALCGGPSVRTRPNRR